MNQLLQSEETLAGRQCIPRQRSGTIALKAKVKQLVLGHYSTVMRILVF
jgi:hypothetical protein